MTATGEREARPWRAHSYYSLLGLRDATPNGNPAPDPEHFVAPRGFRDQASGIKLPTGPRARRCAETHAGRRGTLRLPAGLVRGVADGSRKPDLKPDALLPLPGGRGAMGRRPSRHRHPDHRGGKRAGPAPLGRAWSQTSSPVASIRKHSRRSRRSLTPIGF